MENENLFFKCHNEENITINNISKWFINRIFNDNEIFKKLKSWRWAVIITIFIYAIGAFLIIIFNENINQFCLLWKILLWLIFIITSLLPILIMAICSYRYYKNINIDEEKCNTLDNIIGVKVIENIKLADYIINYLEDNLEEVSDKTLRFSQMVSTILLTLGNTINTLWITTSATAEHLPDFIFIIGTIMCIAGALVLAYPSKLFNKDQYKIKHTIEAYKTWRFRVVIDKAI